MTEKVPKETPPMDLKTLERELREVVRKTKTLFELFENKTAGDVFLTNPEDMARLYIPIVSTKILQLFAAYYGLDPASVKVEK